jgi:hypothetical protein
MISASVAPLPRFGSAMTSAFLLARSDLGFLAGFLARRAKGILEITRRQHLFQVNPPLTGTIRS